MSVFLLTCILVGTSTSASAANAADFKAGRIIDNAVFNSSGSMTVQQVQNFLNAKVPSCDNWGQKPYAGTTRRAYAEARGVVFPLTCVKDYHENPTTHQNNLEGRGIPAGAKSAAQIIWEVGQQYSINPQVLIVLLEKEQALVFDEWPWPRQFRAATGFGCPDTAPCNEQYYGFYNQVHNAARQFRNYANYPQSFNHVPNQNNFVRWSPNSACGGSTVYIENQATASLYNYTPYQPNQAALANLYGTGDSCSAYGNRNFWRMFTDWFGSTLIYDPFGWDVIRTASDGRYFLVVGNTKRWIPTGEIYNDWKLSTKPVSIVSDQYFNSIPTIPPLDRLGYYGNRYYFVDGGKKYWLSNDSLLQAWGQYDKRHVAAPAYSVLSTIPDGGEATFYASQTQQSEVAILLNGQRHLITATHADRWRANPITLTASSFNALPNAGQVNYFASVNNAKYVVDNGKLLNVNDTATLHSFNLSGQTFPTLPPKVLELLPPQSASALVRPSDSPVWYQLVNGRKFPVPSRAQAQAWGLPSDPTVISPRLSADYTMNTTGPATAVVFNQTDNKYYLLDGTKHEIGGVLYDAIQGGSAFTTVTSADLASLPTGEAITSPIIRSRETGHIYSFINGELYHVPSSDVLHGLGHPRKYAIAQVADSFIATFAPSKQVQMFMVSGGVTYFLQDGNAFPLAEATKNDWTQGSTVVAYASPNFGSRFNIASVAPLGQFIVEAGKKMLVSAGTVRNASQYADAYETGQPWLSLAVFGMRREAPASYLARSTDSSDSRVWLINKGTKQHILTGSSMSAYSKNGAVGVMTLSPSILAALPHARGGITPAPLIHTEGQGFKLLQDDGSFMGFGNADTAIHFSAGTPPLQLSGSMYATFNYSTSNVSRLIRAPSGTVYWVENGQKRWITNGSAYQRYSNTPLSNVTSGVVDWLPNGPAID